MALKAEDLTEDERAQIAAEPRQPTKNQLTQIEVQRMAESWFDKHDGEFPRTTANVTTLIDVMKQHGLDPRVEANWDQIFQLLSQADLLEPAAPAAPAAHVFSPREIDEMDSATYRQHYFQTPGFKELVDSQPVNSKPESATHARQQFKK